MGTRRISCLCLRLQDQHGTSLGMGLSCLLPGVIMGQETGGVIMGQETGKPKAVSSFGVLRRSKTKFARGLLVVYMPG